MNDEQKLILQNLLRQDDYVKMINEDKGIASNYE